MESSNHLPMLLPDTESYKTSKYRFVVVVLYSVAVIMNLSLGICFSPIQTNLENIYGESIFIVNFCTRLIGNIATPPFTFLANYILDQYGLLPGIIIGNISSLVSLWISVLAPHGFYYLFVGQIIVSIGHAFLLCAPQKISVTWFPANERVLATTIMSMSILLGNAIGAQFPNFFVDNNATGESGMNQVYNMLLFMAILGSVLITPSFCFFKAKPPHPPSKAAEARKFPYLKSLKILFTDSSTLFLIIGASLLFGTNMTIAAVLQFLLQPYGFTNAQISYYITFSIVLGFIGSLGISAYVNKTKKYKRTVMSLGVATLCLLILMIVAVQSESPIFFGVIFCAFGFMVNPMYPLIVEFMCELSFPVGEATAGSIFYTLGQIVGTGESFAADALLKDSTRADSLHTFYLMIGVDIIGILCFLVVRQDLKRIKYEGNSGNNLEDNGENNQISQERALEN